jgi:D-aminopeptidase
MVEGVDAIVLSGGSAFGLGAADGVMAGLRDDNRGVLVAGHRVPIVPSAILFDLANGGDKSWEASPYPALGRTAYDTRQTTFALGTVGAGYGATIAGMKGGTGSASVVLSSGACVGALVAVNALGQVTVGDTGHFWAAPFEHGDEFGGKGNSPDLAPPPRTKASGTGNTTIAVVATDVTLTKAQATRMATAAHDGLARAIVPAHTPLDGDLIFACTTAQRDATEEDVLLLGHVAATCLARAIARGVFEATAHEGDLVPSYRDIFQV